MSVLLLMLVLGAGLVGSVSALGGAVARSDEPSPFAAATVSPVAGTTISYADWLGAGKQVVFTIAAAQNFPCGTAVYNLVVRDATGAVVQRGYFQKSPSGCSASVALAGP